MFANKVRGLVVATTVEGGFDALHGRLTPTATESAAAKAHRKSIHAALDSRFAMTSFFRTGSFGHGTSVRGSSDIDYFAVIPTAHLTLNSNTTLNYLREVLDRRFPRTGVGVRGPRVLVPFGTNGSESTDVIPADFAGQTAAGQSVYEIPDRHGGWMRASPSAHNAYVNDIDQKLGGKVRPLIRFIKAWRNNRNVPLRSFYLELRVANYAAGESGIIYGMDVQRIFKHLRDIGLAGMHDPVAVSGTIYGVGTTAHATDALSKLETALARADNALAAAKTGDIRKAFQWWDLVFDGHFPAYG